MSHDSVVLVGPRACGKNLVGEILASRSGLPFVDADAVFSQLCNSSISNFRSKYGWTEFRRCETLTLENICSSYPGARIILAAGGGAVAHNDSELNRSRNVKLLREFGFLFYLLPYENLGMNAVILQYRVELNASSALQRPTLTDIKDRYLEMLAVLKQRNDFYLKAAHHVLYTGRKSPEQVADDICAIIRKETAPIPLALTA